MKIAIVGAGISGLAQYVFLCKVGLTDDHEVTLYEARKATDRSVTGEGNLETYNASVIGAAIGISPTGRKVLQRLDSDLYDEILRNGHVIRSWKMSSARGWVLADIPAGGQNETMIMIGRETLWWIFSKRVPEHRIIRKKVLDVKLAVEGTNPFLLFDDGTSENFGLIVSADGIWSVGRKAMFGGKGREEYEFSAHYEGLVGVGGFVPSSMFHDVPEGQMNIVNGGNGFFGYGYCTGAEGDPYKHGDTATWWSTYSLRDLPEDWRHINRDDVKKELKRRHLGWNNKTIQNIVANVEVDSLYPQLITPLLPTWEKGGCVLVGDAAHALQPSSGQGVSMALEDCETLALLLKHYLGQDVESAIVKSARQYSDIRRPRLDVVYKKAQELAGMKQDMGLVQEMIMYFFIWLFSKFKFNEAYQKRLNEYDVPQAVDEAIDRDN